MSGVVGVIAPLFVVLAAAWVTLLVAAPLLPAAAAAVTYALCSLICHQIAERSYYLGAAQLPVCARCLGIYGGVAIAAAAALLRTPIGVSAGTMVALGALPTLATVAAEWAGLWQTSNVVRFVAGAPLGAAVGVVVIAALATLHCGECAPRPPIASSPPPSRT